jgi:hypothetical protein
MPYDVEYDGSDPRAVRLVLRSSPTVAHATNVGCIVYRSTDDVRPNVIPFVAQIGRTGSTRENILDIDFSGQAISASDIKVLGVLMDSY